MTELEKAINWYNKILFDIGREHRTIGTPHSEGTTGWGVADMVKEAEHWLSWYYEPGVSREDFPLNEAYRLKRFIDKYKPMSEGQPTMDDIIDEYNPLMFETCQWHCTIGTGYSVGTENWGLTKIVGQVEFVLDMCTHGHASGGVKLDEVVPAMQQFINKYKPMVEA